MIILSGCLRKHQGRLGEKMGNAQAAYAFIGFVSFLLSVVFFFIDGMLLWSIGFFVLAIMLVLVKVTWDIGGWAENVTRKMGED